MRARQTSLPAPRLGLRAKGPSTAALGRSRQACLTRVRHPWRTRSSPKQAAPKRFDDVAVTCRALPGPPPFTRSPDSSLRRLRVGARCPLLLLRGVEAGLLGRPPLGGPAFRATSYTPPWPLSRRRVGSSEVDGCRMASRRATSLLSLSCAACSRKHRRRGRRRHLSRGVRQGRSWMTYAGALRPALAGVAISQRLIRAPAPAGARSGSTSLVRPQLSLALRRPPCSVSFAASPPRSRSRPAEDEC